MTTIRILDVATLRFWRVLKSNSTLTTGYKLVILNMFSIAVLQEQSRRNGLAFHICFLPLQLFIGFNIANRWIL